MVDSLPPLGQWMLVLSHRLTVFITLMPLLPLQLPI